MIYDVNKFADYLVATKIDANQFLICLMIDSRDTVNLEKFLSIKPDIGEDINMLLKKGYILSTNPNAKTFKLGDLVVSLDIAEILIVEPDEAFDELLEVYPKKVTVNGVPYPSTGLKLEEERLAKESYTKALKKNKFLHREIINSLIEWKKDIGEEAPFKIDKFITSKFWKELKEAKENNVKPRFY